MGWLGDSRADKLTNNIFHFYGVRKLRYGNVLTLHQRLMVDSENVHFGAVSSTENVQKTGRLFTDRIDELDWYRNLSFEMTCNIRIIDIQQQPVAPSRASLILFGTYN